MINTNTKKYLDLFIPSAFGVVFYTFFSGLVIILHQFSFIREYLEIPRDVDFLRMFTHWLDRVVTSSIGQSTTETLVVGLFWAFVGLGVYVFLRGVARFLNDLGEGLDKRNYLWPQGASRNQALMEAVQRIAFRIFAFVALAVVFMGPLMRLINGPAYPDFSTSLRLLVWFVSLWLMLHMCVVLMRMVALRPRLFS